MSDKQPPTLEEALIPPVEQTTPVSIPVLNEVINNEELENSLLANLDLPDELRQQLAQRITALVQQRLAQALPEIMQEIQQEVSQTIQQHMAENLPQILSDALKGLSK